MSSKTRSSLVVIGPNLGPRCLHCLLSLLKLIFKAYKDLTPFIFFFFHMYLLHEQKRNLLSEGCSGYYWWIL